VDAFGVNILTMEKENKMKTHKTGFGKNMAILSVFVMIMLVIVPATVYAAFDCTVAGSGDYDNDGFTDYQECNGFTLADGTLFPGVASALARSERLDPETKDLFVIIVPLANGSLMTDASGNLITDPTATLANVGIAAHVIVAVSGSATEHWVANRQVSTNPSQYAVKITEDPDGTLKSGRNYLPFGDSHYGTPNDLDGATVWTQRIKNYVEQVACTTNAPCTDEVSGASGRDAVINAYIENVMAHEVGHVMKLTDVSISKYNGNHYAPGSDTVMEQSILYKTSRKDGSVTFPIPQAYAAGDDALTTLK
jgi:hypothetical protein